MHFLALTLASKGGGGRGEGYSHNRQKQTEMQGSYYYSFLVQLYDIWSREAGHHHHPTHVICSIYSAGRMLHLLITLGTPIYGKKRN